MRLISLLVMLLLGGPAATSAQTTIPADSASRHVGETVTVCAEVFGVKSLEKLTFINIGAAYPNSPLTVVVFAEDRSNFPEPLEKLYGNKLICVTGKIELFKGRTEIVVKGPLSIQVQ